MKKETKDMVFDNSQYYVGQSIWFACSEFDGISKVLLTVIEVHDDYAYAEEPDHTVYQIDEDTAYMFFTSEEEADLAVA